jgi:hypothetical protein
MEIFYLNDEHQPVTIQVNNKLMSDGNLCIDYFTLQPQEGKLFNIDAPAGSIPYVKRWETRIVLLTYLPAESIPRFRNKVDGGQT